MNSEGEGTDRLSGLPECVIIHILSFLPTVEAVRTMLISKSFITLWTLLPSLHLVEFSFLLPGGKRCYDALGFCKFVRNLLKHHKRPEIDKLRFDVTNMFYESHQFKMEVVYELKSCINFALRKHVKTLDLILHLVLSNPDTLVFELISDSLVQLSLAFIDMNFVTQIQLGSLKVLRLLCVRMSDSVLGKIICDCPSLKELEINHCRGLNELSFAAPNVEKLSFFEYDFPPLLTINCPNIKSIHFIGYVHRVEIVNLSSLVDVIFDLRGKVCELEEFSKFTTVVMTLLSVERVSFSDQFVTVLFYSMLKHASELLKTNWKRAIFSMCLTEKHIHGLNCMLRNSPHLEELVIDITSGQVDFVKQIEAQFEDDVLDNDDCWKSMKCVTINNIANSSYQVLVSFTELLLKKAPDLNKLMFRYGGRRNKLMFCYGGRNNQLCNLTTKELTEFTEKMSTFSKASPHVKISCVK